MTEKDNIYNENITKHILLSRFNNIYKVLDNRKQPKIDLYDFNQDIGVEITMANLSDDEYKAINCALCDKEYESNNYKVNNFFGGFNITSKKYGDTDAGYNNLAVDLFKNSFEKKNKHHENHYNEYNCTDLFIHDLLHFHILSDKQFFIEKILKYLKNFNEHIRFRYIYFEIFTTDDCCTIFMFDTTNFNYRCVDISVYEMNIINLYTLYEKDINKLHSLHVQEKLKGEGINL